MTKTVRNSCLHVILTCMMTIAALPQAVAMQSYDLELETGTVPISEKTTLVFIKVLKSGEFPVLHGLGAFSRDLSQNDRLVLNKAGISILAAYDDFVYAIAVQKDADFADASVDDLLRALAILPPDRKIKPTLRRPDDAATIDVTVVFFPLVPSDIAIKLLKCKAKSYKQITDDTYIAKVDPRRLEMLAASDVVIWIEEAPLAPRPENNVTRAADGVDAIQNFNTNSGQAIGLGGVNVTVGIFDFGVDETHADFTGRLITKDNPARQFHGTHVAGTIVGNGKNSDGSDRFDPSICPTCVPSSNGGTPYEWRGMAPSARFIEAVGGGAQAGSDPILLEHYTRTLGMDVSNHSYALGCDGDYNAMNRIRDRAIRGDLPGPNGLIPPRLQVFSSGDNGSQALCASQQGYFSLTKEVKNGLVVGSWDVRNSMIDGESSLGPTYDGRIKPDIVAPGVSIESTAYDTVQGRHDYYGVQGGTSMAAAAVTGALALILEQYSATYGIDLDVAPPLPSTLRAILVNSADDAQSASPWFTNTEGAIVQAFPGPDFVTGFGVLNAKNATSIVASKALVETSLSQTCDSMDFRFMVGSGAVKITLAWDDPASLSGLLPTKRRLINDLDLILVDPNGQLHFPWRLNHTTKNLFGQVVPDGSQHCGASYVFSRDCAPGTVADTLPLPGLMSATGRDHLNDIEQVEIPAQQVVPGEWVAKVVGFRIRFGPQTFSLIGAQFY